jgi:hypothetical protein
MPKKKMVRGPSSTQMAAAQKAQAAYFAITGATRRRPGDVQSASSIVDLVDAAPDADSLVLDQAAKAAALSGTREDGSAPDVDNNSRFLEEHARRKAEEVGDAEDAASAGELEDAPAHPESVREQDEPACGASHAKRARANKGASETLDVLVPPGAPGVFDSASIPEELSRLRDHHMMSQRAVQAIAKHCLARSVGDAQDAAGATSAGDSEDAPAHAESVREQDEPAYGANHCKDAQANEGASETLDAVVPPGAPGVFDSASIRQELSDQVSTVLHGSEQHAAEVVLSDASESLELPSEPRRGATVGHGVAHPSAAVPEDNVAGMWTQENANVNPKCEATSQKNPTTTTHEMKGTHKAILQEQIVSLADNCARKVEGTASKSVTDDILTKMKHDLEQQNQELEAAIDRMAAATQLVDPKDKFFSKLERVLIEWQKEQGSAEVAVIPTVQPNPNSSVQDQLQNEISLKMALQSKIELLLRVGNKKKDADVIKEAQEKLTKIQSDIVLCQAQVAMIGNSCDAAANAHISPSSVKREGQGASPGPAALAVPDGANGDVAVVIQPPDSAALRVASACRREAIMRFSFAGKCFFLMAALVSLSAPVAPYCIPVAPAVLLFMLGVYQTQYASSVLEEEQSQAEEDDRDEGHDHKFVDFGAMPQTPWKLEQASILLSLLLLISCLAFGYALYTTMDMLGTPACTVDQTFQTRFTPSCKDPVSAEQGVSHGTQTISNAAAVSASTPVSSSPSSEGSEALDPSIPASANPDHAPIPPAGGVEETPLPAFVGASSPTLEPAGGDFTGYGWVILNASDEYDWLIYSQDANADLSCNVSSGGEGLKHRVLILDSGIVKTRACCRSCGGPSEIIVGNYRVIPGPTVTVKLLLAGSASAADLNVDLTPLQDRVASLVKIDSRLIVSKEAMGARQNSFTAYISFRIVSVSAQTAAQLARQAQQINVDELNVAGGGLIVSRVEVSIFDPSVDLAEAPGVDAGPDLDNVTVVSEIARPSHSCVNAISESQYKASVRSCNDANVCVGNVIKTTYLLSCPANVYITGLSAVVMLTLSIFVSTYTRFAIRVLER